MNNRLRARLQVHKIRINVIRYMVWCIHEVTSANDYDPWYESCCDDYNVSRNFFIKTIWYYPKEDHVRVWYK